MATDTIKTHRLDSRILAGLALGVHTIMRTAMGGW